MKDLIKTKTSLTYTGRDPEDYEISTTTSNNDSQQELHNIINSIKTRDKAFLIDNELKNEITIIEKEEYNKIMLKINNRIEEISKELNAENMDGKIYQKLIDERNALNVRKNQYPKSLNSEILNELILQNQNIIKILKENKDLIKKYFTPISKCSEEVQMEVLELCKLFADYTNYSTKLRKKDIYVSLFKKIYKEEVCLYDVEASLKIYKGKDEIPYFSKCYNYSKILNKE